MGRKKISEMPIPDVPFLLEERMVNVAEELEEIKDQER